jgi:hypothetical protein
MRSPTGEVIFGGETMRFWVFASPKTLRPLPEIVVPHSL